MSEAARADEPSQLEQMDHASSLAGPTEEPPDGGYGWVCVVAVFLINAHTWGLNSSYGVFLAYYLKHNIFPGATHLEYALLGGSSISQALIVSPLATTVIRLYGTQAALRIGIVLETIALVGASFAQRYIFLLLTQGLCFGWGMGFLFVGSVGIVPQWFRKRRSVANGIVTGGSGIGGLVYSLVSNAVIQRYGLAWTFRILAVVQFFVNVVCATLLRDRNRQIGVTNRAFDYRLFRRPELLLFSLPDYAASIGLTAQRGSVVGALLNLAQGLGRPLVGYFSDAAGRITTAGNMTLFTGLLCFVFWIPANTYASLTSFALLVGLVCGTFWTSVAPVGAEVVGLVELPSLLSITWVVLVLPTTFAEAIALELRQSTGHIYRHVQLFTGSMYLAAAICIWLLRAWKNREMARAAAETETPVQLQMQVEVEVEVEVQVPAAEFDVVATPEPVVGAPSRSHPLSR
ncbi:MAG: hypothetical protein M1826_000913 [Phylliscum demangeonii]|nr:MAG: hypothetical protein M1826_000913 [Phylliscum demangeonii]